MTAHADALERHLTLLQTTYPLWHPRAFCDRDAPWLAPPLATWLRSLSSEAIASIHAGLASDADLHPDYRALRAAVRGLPTIPASSSPRYCAPHVDPRGPIHPHARRFVDERKLRQLAAIQARVAPLAPATRMVDWCGGKGHLARAMTLAFGGQATVVERNPDVIASGAELHEKAGLPTQWLQADVLLDDTSDVLGRSDTAFALHACGELTATLLDRAQDSSVRHIVALPCCPHMTGTHSCWHPRSSLAKASTLTLTTPDLKLAIADEVVAAARHRTHRRREQRWRLAADIALRELRRADSYQTIGPLPPRAFRQPLDIFLHDVLVERGVAAPSTAQVARWSNEADDALRTVQAIGLVRALFREPIERFTLLDRAVYLEEQGWTVQLETLFEPQTSPRNTALIARR